MMKEGLVNVESLLRTIGHCFAAHIRFTAIEKKKNVGQWLLLPDISLTAIRYRKDEMLSQDNTYSTTPF